MGHQRSPNQQQASRVNGRRSRGPKTDAGKAKSSNNARKHGLWSKNNKPAPDGDPEFKKHVRRLRRQIKPVNQLERDMIRQYAVAFWLKEQVLAAAHDMAPESFNRLLTSQDLSLHRALKAIGGLLKGKFGPRAYKIETTFVAPPHLRKRYGEPKKQTRQCENDPGEVVENKPAPQAATVQQAAPCYIGKLEDSMAKARSQTLETGQVAPDLTLKTPEGEAVHLGALLENGPVLLAFHKASCPVCQLALPFLDRLKDAPFKVFNVSQDSAGTARDFAREFDLTTPFLLDPERDGYPASNACGITHVPAMFLIEKDRKVKWSSVGFYKRELQALAAIAGCEIFKPGEWVPEAKAG